MFSQEKMIFQLIYKLDIQTFTPTVLGNRASMKKKTNKKMTIKLIFSASFRNFIHFLKITGQIDTNSLL